ncbi:hypothetical protein PPNSA23_41460 [Phyllobacterium phragmitis]|uniref:Uncharacterized protein n=1 Tax=Phyllobacterium phragmitis TaxID=2670329 RepID=A0ABQ0H5L2_9HYPH
MVDSRTRDTEEIFFESQYASQSFLALISCFDQGKKTPINRFESVFQTSNIGCAEEAAQVIQGQ